MSRAEPIEPSDPQAEGSDVPKPTKPDWLVGADESIGREADPGSSDGPRRQSVPVRQDRKETPHLELVAAPDAAPPPTPEAPTGEPAGERAWKAAASSVPRLRQQPAASTQPAASESFAGFAQDAMMTKNATAVGGHGALSAADLLADGASEDVMPLAEEPPFWIQWLEQLRSLPRPVLIGVGVVLVLGAAAYVFYPRGGTPGVSLAQILQHPEAFEGRSVRVGGKAGEAFSVGGSYIFNLSQGRDTIVIYSRTRPRLNARVKVDGTVSIGYLDGAPRVALLESPSAP